MFKLILLLVAVIVGSVLAVANPIPYACRTRPGQTVYGCNLLRRRWLGGKCDAYKAANLDPWVAWVGPGCPTPCAVKAKDMHQNPRAYCKANGNKNPSYGDGGCKLGADCNIFCQETCENHPNCVWKASGCQIEYEAPAPGR